MEQQVTFEYTLTVKHGIDSIVTPADVQQLLFKRLIMA